MAEKKQARITHFKGSVSIPLLSTKTQIVSATGKDTNAATSAPVRRLSPAQVEEYRRKSLCFKCDEPYSPGHKCKGKSLMLIECEDSENELDEEILLKPRETVGENLPELSLHAMDGSVSPKTIRLIGQVNRKPLNVLLDRFHTQFH